MEVEIKEIKDVIAEAKKARREYPYGTQIELSKKYISNFDALFKALNVKDKVKIICEGFVTGKSFREGDVKEGRVSIQITKINFPNIGKSKYQQYKEQLEAKG